MEKPDTKRPSNCRERPLYTPSTPSKWPGKPREPRISQSCKQKRPIRFRNRDGFTLVELLLVIAIIVLLAALLLPVFSAVREKGRQAVCVSQEKQMGQALRLYVDDYDGAYPTYADRLPDGSWVSWHQKLRGYGLTPALLICPSSKTTTERETVQGSGSYGYSYYHLGAWPGHIALEGLLVNPSGTIAIGEITRRAHSSVLYPPPYDGGSVPTDSGGPPWVAVTTEEERLFAWTNASDRHGKGQNILWCDGHVSRKLLSELERHTEWWSGAEE